MSVTSIEERERANFPTETEENEEWNRVNAKRLVKVSTMIDCLQPLLLFNKLLGIDIDLLADATTSCRRFCTNTYVYLLLLCNCMYSILNVWSIYKFIKSLADDKVKRFSLVYYVDQGMSIVIFLHFMVRRKQINVIVKRVLTVALSSSEHSGATYRITKRYIYCLSLAGGFFYASQLVFTLTMALTEDDKIIVNYLEEYLTFHSPVPPQYRVALVLIFNLYYMTVIMTGVGFYLVFVIVLCYLLAQCFKHLNDDIRSGKYVLSVHLHAIQRHHQEIANLVQQFNEKFSPLIFIFVITFIFKMATGIGTLFDDFQMNVYLFYLPTVLTVGRSIFLFLVFTHTASRVNEESKLILDVLLNGFLSNSSSTNNSIGCKNHHLTSLFVAQRMSVPIGITASGLFVINYSFLALVASSLATYASILMRM